MNSFEAIPATVFEGDDTDLILRVQNKGEPLASDVKAYLYSYGDLSLSGPTTDFQDADDLDPPTDEFEGEMKDIEWTMDTTGMNLAGTQKETANCYARVYYKYNTSAKVAVPVISKDEYKKRVERDETLPSKGPVTVTRGPFTVEITSRDPVLVEDAPGEKTFKVYITAENLVSGTPYHLDAHPSGPNNRPKGDSLERIEMSVDPSNKASISECSSGSNTWSDTGSHNVSVRRGEKARLSCEIQVNNANVPRQDIPVTVVMHYGYYMDTSVPVTVEGEA